MQEQEANEHLFFPCSLYIIVGKNCKLFYALISKRDRIPRESLAQAIDYASDVSSWDFEKLSEECEKYRKQTLETYINDNFEDVKLEDISVNQTQRILLVGTYIEEPLERMIDWLSNNYEVGVNAVIFKYIRTAKGEELLARTMIISEDVEKERTQKQQRKVPISDEPGAYADDELRTRLGRYLSQERDTIRRIREVLIPLCQDHEPVKRDEIKNELIKKNLANDERHAWVVITAISRELGFKDRDYLRQVIRYDKPNPWERENYRIEGEYKEMLADILSEIRTIKG